MYIIHTLRIQGVLQGCHTMTPTLRSNPDFNTSWLMWSWNFVVLCMFICSICVMRNRFIFKTIFIFSSIGVILLCSWCRFSVLHHWPRVYPVIGTGVRNKSITVPQKHRQKRSIARLTYYYIYKYFFSSLIFYCNIYMIKTSRHLSCSTFY